MTNTLRCGIFFCLLVLGGCSAATEGRQEVRGEITFAGRPLDHGVIQFLPKDPEGQTRASALVTDGKYLIPKTQGLMPGVYRVSISSPDGRTPAVDTNAAPGPSGNFTSKERIPAMYNLTSQIEFEVRQGQPNIFDQAIP